jgi:hypothetical protein
MRVTQTYSFSQPPAITYPGERPLFLVRPQLLTLA